MTWPVPLPDVGAEAGELRRPDDELFEVPELDAAGRVLLAAEPEDVAAEVAVAVAPGRAKATAAAAIRLAAAAETVAARSRAWARSRAAAPEAMVC